MEPPLTRAFGIVLLAALVGAASAQDLEEDASLMPSDREVFQYDWMHEMASPEDIAALIAQYEVVQGLQDVPGPLYGCRVTFRDWPCRRKRVLGVEFPVPISDVLPIHAGDHDERALYLADGQSGGFDAFLVGPTPPPTPYGILDATDLARVRGQVDAYDDALLDADGMDLGQPTSGSPAMAFDAEAVAWAYRHLLWTGIEDYTSFAPVERVLHGRDVLDVIAGVAGRGPTDCPTTCPAIVQKVISAQQTVYWYCARITVDGLALPPSDCTPIAFVVDGKGWLRTRLVYGVADGRGAGPMELFRCESGKSADASVAALAQMFKATFRSETRTRSSAGGVQLVAVSWRDRASEVAANRWEVFYFDGVVQPHPSPSPGSGARTLLEYQLPIYRLSDSRPTSIDAGLPAKEEIVRRFESSLRQRLAKALAPATCNPVPEEWSL